MTTEELQLKIAEARGWRNVRPVTRWYEDYYDTYERKIWIGESPDGSGETKLPDWTTEPADALLLCYEVAKKTDDDLVIAYLPGEDEGIVVGFSTADLWAGPDDILCDSWEGAQMADALARLWWKWHEEKS